MGGGSNGHDASEASQEPRQAPLDAIMCSKTPAGPSVPKESSESAQRQQKEKNQERPPQPADLELWSQQESLMPGTKPGKGTSNVKQQRGKL